MDYARLEAFKNRWEITSLQNFGALVNFYSFGYINKDDFWSIGLKQRMIQSGFGTLLPKFEDVYQDQIYQKA
jgi:hypothetical protein